MEQKVKEIVLIFQCELLICTSTGCAVQAAGTLRQDHRGFLGGLNFGGAFQRALVKTVGAGTYLEASFQEVH